MKEKRRVSVLSSAQKEIRCRGYLCRVMRLLASDIVRPSTLIVRRTWE